MLSLKKMGWKPASYAQSQDNRKVSDLIIKVSIVSDQLKKIPQLIVLISKQEERQ